MLTEPIRWCRMRSELGFVYYEGYALCMSPGGIEDSKVATVHPNDHYQKKFKVQILDHAPSHRRSLTSAKKDAEHIYASTTR